MVDDITRSIEGLTDRIVVYRAVVQTRKKADMDRLAEKLAKAGGVVNRITAKIEARADALIARENELEERTHSAFSPHEGILSSAERGLDDVEKALALLSNGGPPLEASRPLSLEDPANLAAWILNNKISMEQHNAAIAAGHVPESRYYFEYIEQHKPTE